MSKESNIVYIGIKPPMNYVLAVITSFNMSNTKEVVLKARGQAISTAVDVAEITRRRFMKELNVDKITVGTEEMPPREGESRTRMVSTIEITLTVEAQAKRRGKSNAGNQVHTTEATKELV